MIAFLGDIRNALGESPLWDARCGWLWWVDSTAGRIAAATPDGIVRRDWTFDRAVGSIALAPDGLVAAFADGFALVSDDGKTTSLAMPDLGAEGLRFNDGKTDRQGRFLSGTIGHTDDVGSLWRLAGDHATRIETGIRIANAISFSPAGDILYFADSIEGGVRRYAYDAATGALGSRDWLIDPATLGTAADGATVDSEGRVWVALVLDQAIVCVAPDGRLLERIATPIPYPSCPAFGGDDLATMYLTSISSSGRLTSDDPDAGRIMVIDGLGATGIAETPYNHTRN